MTERITITRDMIEETFDGAASLYNKSKIFRESGQRLADLVSIKPGFLVLDIACGTGAVAIPAARCVETEGHVTGIDISGKMLEKAKQEADKEDLGNIDFIRMDAESLEFPDSSFDVVTCAFGIFYFPRSALSEMYRVCKPGGTIGLGVFESWTPDPASPGIIINQLIREYGKENSKAKFPRFRYAWPTRFSVNDIESLLAEYGFTDIETVKERLDTVYNDFEDFWEMLFSGGSRLTLVNMDEKTQSRFKKELQERLSAVSQADGIRLPETAIFAIAKK